MKFTGNGQVVKNESPGQGHSQVRQYGEIELQDGSKHVAEVIFSTPSIAVLDAIARGKKLVFTVEQE